LTEDVAQLLGLENKNSTISASKKTTTTTSASHPPSVDGYVPQSHDIAAPNTERKPVQSVQQSTSQQIHPFGRQYVSHPRSVFNGQDYVEEHQEKMIGIDGETRIATRRRLGDRWYENEIHIDEDGQKTERETWHNVGDEDIERFKLEWNEKHPNTKTSHDHPAVQTGLSDGQTQPNTIETPPNITAVSNESPQ
jgi:hypothetical protein